MNEWVIWIFAPPKDRVYFGIANGTLYWKGGFGSAVLFDRHKLIPSGCTITKECY